MKFRQITTLLLLPLFCTAQNNLDSLILAVGDSIEISLYENNTAYLSKLFIEPAFPREFLEPDLNNENLKKINQGIVNKNKGELLSEELTHVIQKHGHYSFISYIPDRENNSHTLTFRLFRDKGVNYHQYNLSFVKNHTPVLRNIFIFSQGEYLSNALLDAYRSKYSQIVQEENLSNGKTSFETVSEKRKISSFMQNIDRYILEKRFEEALNMVDSVDYFVDDEFLDYYRGGIHFSAGNNKEAVQYLNVFQSNFPYLAESYDGLLNCYYRMEQFEQVIPLLELIETNIELTPEYIHSFVTSDYPNLLDKNVYLEWCEKKSIDTLTEFQQEINSQYANPEESPLTKKDLDAFTGLEFFSFDHKYQIQAQFIRTENEDPFEMPTTTRRRPIYLKYGEAHFKLDGISYQLNVYQSQALIDNEEFKDYLFLPFTDLSNGNDSYGGGRFIDLKIPEGDAIEIDFNKAYNPYCAYNSIYSCPIPPEENHLNIEIRAGVKSPH